MTMQDANAGNNSQIFLGLFTCVELVRFVYTVRANLSRFNVFVLSVVGDARRQRDACGDFVNLEDLPAQSSKMFLEVGFTCVYS
jgi:hypothetical protein